MSPTFFRVLPCFLAHDVPGCIFSAPALKLIISPKELVSIGECYLQLKKKKIGDQVCSMLLGYILVFGPLQ
jgi:hypothetical protein